VRKLSSYVRQNQTKKALWELDNLCRTRYILRFINDVNLRQAVQKALNRGEAYHRFNWLPVSADCKRKSSDGWS
jgi:TnpA family transposase